MYLVNCEFRALQYPTVAVLFEAATEIDEVR